MEEGRSLLAAPHLGAAASALPRLCNAPPRANAGLRPRVLLLYCATHLLPLLEVHVVVRVQGLQLGAPPRVHGPEVEGGGALVRGWEWEEGGQEVRSARQFC